MALGRAGCSGGQKQPQPGARSFLRLRGLGLGLLVGWGLAGCAPWQAVRIDAQPEPVRVFVDGEPVAEIPATGLRLRADRSHILHFEREGYRAEQVIVESHGSSSGPELRPENISVRLRPVEVRGRKIDVELQSLQVEEGGEK